MKETFDIEGMTCAACSARVQKAASGVDGVACANVNLLKNSMELDYDGAPETAAAVVEAIEKSGYGARRRAPRTSGTRATEPAERPGAAAERAITEKRNQLVVSAIFSVPLFYVAMGPMFGWPQPPALAGEQGMMAAALTQLLLCAPILVANRHYFVTGFRTLAHRAPNMDSLIALGSAASAVWSVAQLYRMALGYGSGDLSAVHAAAHNLYFDSAGMILTLITLGKYFEARAKGRTTDAITALMDLAPKTATVLRDGSEVVVPVEDVAVGERVVFPQKDIGLAVHQLVELNVVRAEDLRDDVAVEVAEVEDADLAAQACDVVDDLARLALADGEIVFGGIEALGHLHEGLDREGIVLRRHAELLFQRVGMRVLLRQRLILVVDLTGIVDELLPVVRQRHAASAAVEDGDAELTLQLLHRAGERGLGDVEPFRRLVHRAGL